MHPSLLQALGFLLLGIGLIVLLTVRFRVHAFFALLIACFVVGLGMGMPLGGIVSTAKDGFGNIMKSLGFIIVLGTTLGAILEKTGSTAVMAEVILRITGQTRAALAMALTGFIVGLPIFCDSGFIVLSGLNKSLARRSGVPMAYMAAALAGALYGLHCLIPPHPGAAAAAALIGVDYGRLIMMGIGVAISATVAGHLYVRLVTRGMKGDVGEEAVEEEKVVMTMGRMIWAFVPVVVPILLIALRVDPVIALMVGVVLALVGAKGDILGTVMSEGVEKAGGILVIIGAGGAFGAILTAGNIGGLLSEHLPLAGMGLAFPFLLTATLKTAQGSSTVAIITAASIVKPVLATLGLATGNGPLYCILAMGAGSMMLSHANDAYFWVIARFSGLDLKTMLRVYTVATLVMGLTAFAVVYILFVI